MFQDLQIWSRLISRKFLNLMVLS